MKRSLLFIALLLCMGISSVMAQNNSACPGLHNPSNFNSTPGGRGSWSARVGDRVTGTGGSTGSNVLSTCARPNKTPIRGNSILSSTYYSGYCTHRCGSCNQCDLFDAHDQRFRIYTSDDQGLDLFTVNAAGQGMMRIPTHLGHNSSIRLGDMRTTGTSVTDISQNGNDKGSEALFYTMLVTSQNSLLFIDYAIVACKYAHTPYDAGEFTIRVCGKNPTTGQWNNFPLTDSLWFNVPAPSFSGALPAPWVDGRPGVSAGATFCGYCYKPWTRVAISLLNYLYDSVRVEMYTSDCLYNVDPIYAYIAGSCQPMTITTSGCPGGSSTAVDTLRAPEGLLSYTWYVSSDGYEGNTSNVEFMNTLNFRQVQASSTNNMYVSQLADFITNTGDTVGTTTYKCVMTSAMDPEKPFQSVLYATVSNTKPIIKAVFTPNCDSTVSFDGYGQIRYQGANAPHLVDSLTRWDVHQGSTDDTPIIGTVYGKNTKFKFYDTDVHCVSVTMVTEDSSCYTTRPMTVTPMLPPHNMLDIDKHTLCVGETASQSEPATITDNTEDIVSRIWILGNDTIDSRNAGNTLNSTRVVTRTFTDFENPITLITFAESGCSDTVFDTIYFFHDPEITYSNDTIVCNGHEAHVVASTPVEGCTFAWYRHRNQAGESPICTGNTLMVHPTQAHTKYYLKITAQAGCEAWDSVNVHLLSTSITSNPANAKFCPGDTVLLTGNGATRYLWYSVPDDPGLAGQTENRTIAVAPAQDTRYYLIGYAADSCDIAAIDILVQRVERPVLDFSYSPNYIDTEVPVVNFTDNSLNRASTQWYFGDGGQTSGQSVTHHFDIYADQANSIQLVSYNELGCSVDTTFWIRIDTFGFYRPNVFTPTKTNNNLFSIVTPNQMESFHIAIYNRRGLLVFESDDQHFTWDGSRNGEPMPTGAYTYVITYSRSGSKSEQRLRGTVMLVR
ncbi:MAG: gliding motility-associated C-terminal domain-containing protein [Bacteroidales bacterium]|nr:gliding motility-associated C-terminal domain-containing protein [Bacteroidales bacterium]